NTTVIFKTNDDIDLKYILALLNSKLLNFYHHKIAKQTGGGVYEYVPNVVGKLPVHIVDINNKDDKEMHDKIVMLVDNIIALNKKLSVEKNPNSITMLNRQINAVDKQIDALVYKLYNLNDEEVKIIEGE
ncbi:TaqI-like C-terminal specificity domain-containing protein, partial [Brachyspira pilosicoli]|uniref:TaqI-like C-terminal specificity domain-containing protein n=1 Tax=Brachyspira pilosicoli TaxID=52584 RepID=UPI0027E49D81